MNARALLLRSGGRELTLLAALLVAVAVFAFLSPVYLSSGNVYSVIRNSVELLLIGLGLTFVLAVGGIDVSVGAVLGIAAIAIGNLLLAGTNPWLAAVAGPLVGLALGAFTGAVIVFGRIPAIVATIGLFGVYRTAIFALLGGSWLSGLPQSLSAIFAARIFGILPTSYIVIAAAYIVSWFVLRRTPYGLHLLAFGSNEERARLSGLAVKRVRIAAYMISGALCGVAATFYVANYRNVEMTVGSTIALDAIAAVVLGGTSILGGRASLLGTALGVLLIRVLQNGFTIVGVPSLWQPVVTGALLLARAVARARRRRRQRPPRAGERLMPRGAAARLGLLLVLYAAIVIGFALYQPAFLQPSQASTALQFASMLALVALGQSLVILAGGAGIDLSVGGTVSLSAILAMMAVGAGVPAALMPLLPPAIGLGLGAINGLLVTRLRILPLIATLGTLFVYGGLAMALTAAPRSPASPPG